MLNEKILTGMKMGGTMDNLTITSIFKKHGLYLGRMISSYKEAPIGEICIWNANVISPSLGKIWYGDINLNKDGEKLKKISFELNETLYVLREMDCRFESENDSIEDMISKSVWNTNL